MTILLDNVSVKFSRTIIINELKSLKELLNLEADTDGYYHIIECIRGDGANANDELTLVR